jgi:hypothetical protein
MSSSEVGKWLDQLFDEMFYQPDDELSQRVMEENVSPDIQIR